MNKSTIIAIVAVVAVAVVIVAAYALMNNGGNDQREAEVNGEWNLVSTYKGSWNGNTPVYSEDTMEREKAKIYHYKNDFFIFETGDDKLYCSWDGKKMVTSDDDDDDSTAIFIMLVPGNTNYMMAYYFDDDDAVIKLYQRSGYTGTFPGFKIPISLPAIGDTLKSFKNKEYAPDKVIDHGVNTLTMKDIEGMMVFYEVLMGDDTYRFVGIYISSGIIRSMGISGDSRIYDMTEYRNGVLYCSSADLESGNIWVTEYGNEATKDYPDKKLTGFRYTGTEDYLIFNDDRIVEQKYGNGMSLKVIMQDDEYLSIVTEDASGREDAKWITTVNDLRPLYHYGISVQSSIVYDGVEYYGEYFGYFPTADCEKLYVYGTLTSDVGNSIVISQKYTLAV